MPADNWSNVNDYIVDTLVRPDPVLERTLASIVDSGMPQISVSPAQGALLGLLVRIQGARRVLELGTLGGYSSIWLARSLPEDGKLVTLELNPRHAEVARANVDAAGVGARVEIRVGPAIASMDAMVSDGEAPFDVIFIDADKPQIPDYFDRALKLSRQGTVILIDNVIRGGTIADAGTDDAGIAGIRSAFARVSSDPDLSATAVLDMRSGQDGLAIIRVER